MCPKATKVSVAIRTKIRRRQLTAFSGIVASSTDRVLRCEPAKPRAAVPEESDSDAVEDEEVAEPVKVLDALATFDELTVWGHDQVPATHDPFVKGIEEWISFAEAIHAPPTPEKSFDVSSG
jgi:ribonuclease H2 subunit C